MEQVLRALVMAAAAAAQLRQLAALVVSELLFLNGDEHESIDFYI
jgi:hypothetical protein